MALLTKLLMSSPLAIHTLSSSSLSSGVTLTPITVFDIIQHSQTNKRGPFDITIVRELQYVLQYTLENRNMPNKNMLGIFRGKKHEYNKLILQSLSYSDKVTKEIALWIVHNSDKKHWKHVYSVIDRPDGRLEELSEKGYLKRENMVWKLTNKGLAVALTLANNTSKILSLIKENVETVDIDKVFERLRQIPFISAFIKPEAFEVLKEVFHSGESYEFIRESTQQLIKKGVDLDSMSEEEFQSVLSALIAHGLLEKKLYESI